MIPYLSGVNLENWIKEKEICWDGGGIHLLWESPDYITFVGRGPTKGKEFHVGPGDEIFYQLRGELHFHYIMGEEERDIKVLRPGEIFLLPAKVPHSPRRPNESSLTLVVERKRSPYDADYWVWFCERCNKKIYQSASRVGSGPDGGSNPELEEARLVLAKDDQLRTCSCCGDLLPS